MWKDTKFIVKFKKEVVLFDIQAKVCYKTRLRFFIIDAELLGNTEELLKYSYKGVTL